MERARNQTTESMVRRMTPVAAPPGEQAQVAALAALTKSLRSVWGSRRPSPPRCKLVGPHGEAIEIPSSVFYVLARVVEVMARGDSVTVVPVGKDLTTQQAADLLNVSRQYLVRLLDDKRIPFSKTGKHRRVRMVDVLRFKDERDKSRRHGLNELSRLTEEFGGYDKEEKL